MGAEEVALRARFLTSFFSLALQPPSLFPLECIFLMRLVNIDNYTAARTGF